jgi:predicted HNH restriction endonuclease
MLISRSDVERLFSVGDVIDSGGRRSQFRIAYIDNDFVRIEPTQSPTKSRLRYDKLAVVVESFASVDAHRIEASVGKLLEKHGLKDTQNESYLYGFAREYLHRSRVLTLTVLELELEREVSKSKHYSPSDRQKRLQIAPRIPEKIIVTTMAFRRNADVIAEVLFRAGGTCEKCQQPAPFMRRADGSPYLEVHHKIPLSTDGEDTVANAIALCPNCHRAAHFA